MRPGRRSGLLIPFAPYSALISFPDLLSLPLSPNPISLSRLPAPFSVPYPVSLSRLPIPSPCPSHRPFSPSRHPVSSPCRVSSSSIPAATLILFSARLPTCLPGSSPLLIFATPLSRPCRESWLISSFYLRPRYPQPSSSWRLRLIRCRCLFFALSAADAPQLHTANAGSAHYPRPRHAISEHHPEH